jgi:hypothetical protein
VAALPFGSFLWARKEKNAPPAGRPWLLISPDGAKKCVWLEFEQSVGSKKTLVHPTRLKNKKVFR